MKEDLIKLRDLITKIITENNLDSIDINNFHGGFELHSNNEYATFNHVINRLGDTKEERIKIGNETEITLSNEHMKLTSSIEEMIRNFGGE